MASFLSKFVRGGSAAAGQLYADSYMQDQRAEIMAKRDSVLNKNRMDLDRQQQEFRSKEAEKTRQARMESPQSQLNEMKLANAKELDSLKKAWADAETDDERREIVKQARNVLGQNFESQVNPKGKMTAERQNVLARVRASTTGLTEEEAYAELDRPKPVSRDTIFKALVTDNSDIMRTEPKLTLKQMKEKINLFYEDDPDQPEILEQEDTSENYISKVLSVYGKDLGEEKVLQSIISQKGIDQGTVSLAKKMLSELTKTQAPIEEAAPPAPPKKQFTDQKDWHLLPDLPIEAREKMTSKMWKERGEHINIQRTEEKIQKEKEEKELLKIKKEKSEELINTFPFLDDDEKKAWFKNNLRYLNTEQRKTALL